MTQRMLQAFGGLLAVATLAAGTSVATGDPGPTANVAGTGGGGGCNDNNAPYSRWGNGWWNHDGQGSYWNGWGDGNGYMDGRAYDRGCSGRGYGFGAQAARAGKVDRVMVAVKRLDGSHCQHLLPSGRLSPPGSCLPTHWIRAKGTSSWRLDIARELPRGRYQLHRRAVDESGNRERQHFMRLSIR